jgi:CSLREA domain-containing protein
MRLGRTLGIAAVAALIAPAAAHADTYRVNKLGDGEPNACTKQHCTLRGAVEAANETMGDDAIVLPPGKTIVLDGAVLISGPSRVEVRPAGRERTTIETALGHFSLDLGADVRLSKLILRGADTQGVGGAIATGAFARLRIDHSRLIANRATEGGGAIVMNGSTVIRRTTIADNETGPAGLGGAIAAGEPSSELKLIQSTVDGNRAFSGGGIISAGRVDVRDSTVSNNVAAFNGGGILMQGEAADLTVTNSTIGQNSAGDFGGGIDAFNGARVAVSSSTIARNDASGDNDPTSQGGNLQNGGTTLFEISNSIVAGGTAAVGPDCSGTYTRAGTNLVEDTAGCQGFLPTEDLLDVAPKVDTQLAANGGPTRTFELKAGSPAVNAAGGSCPKRDQRGVMRKNCDIGAFERR